MNKIQNTFALLLLGFAWVAVLMLALPARAQEEAVRIDLSTPKQTVYTHVNFLRSPYIFSPNKNRYASYSARALAHPNLNLTKEELVERAKTLEKIYRGAGIDISAIAIPDDANYKDTLQLGASEFVLATIGSTPIVLVKEGTRWFYSPETVLDIPNIYNQIFLFDADNLGLGDFAFERFLGLAVWQYIGIFIFIFGGFLAHHLFLFVLDKIILTMFKRIGYADLSERYILPVAKPISFLVVFLFWQLFLPVLQLPAGVTRFIRLSLGVVVPIFVVASLYYAINILTYYLGKLAQRTATTLDDQLVPLLDRTLKVLIVVIGVFFILSNLGFDIGVLVGGLSIGGLAFAFAAQDTLKNFFGSLMILFDRPFQIGDFISGTGISGVVEEVGVRSTRVRTFHGSVTSVPNGKIADMTIDNMGMRRARRFNFNIALTYDTPHDKMQEFVSQLRAHAENHPKIIPPIYIHFNNMGASSLDILFYIFFDTTDYAQELILREETLFVIMKKAEEIGVEFAFPTSTVHISSHDVSPESWNKVFNEPTEHNKALPKS
ncbi:MAG: mechanosensitive ion channel family protein [Bernardetiaceae bacterium]|nr:mechanosensitive ion channel family protein [Bernardetiaceae bacterium]